MHSYRILGRVLKATPSTLCRWRALRHQTHDGLRRPQTRVRKLTNTSIQSVGIVFNVSIFLTRIMLQGRIFQVFDLSVSRQLMGTSKRTARLTRKKSSVSFRDDLFTSACRKRTKLVT